MTFDSQGPAMEYVVVLRFSFKVWTDILIHIQSQSTSWRKVHYFTGFLKLAQFHQILLTELEKFMEISWAMSYIIPNLI